MFGAGYVLKAVDVSGTRRLTWHFVRASGLVNDRFLSRLTAALRFEARVLRLGIFHPRLCPTLDRSFLVEAKSSASQRFRCSMFSQSPFCVRAYVRSLW